VDIHALRYPGMSFDLATGTASFQYELDGPSPLRFTETVTLPLPERLPGAAALGALHRVLELLHVAAGTSYYKVAAPRQVTLDGTRLAGEAMPWVTGLFRQGMAEFAYRNELPHVLDLSVTENEQLVPPNGPKYDNGDEPPLVPVGGGKDSIVTIEALKRAGMRPTLFAVNPNAIIRDVMAVSGLPTLAATRKLDPQLFALNKDGAYNGHVPVTAINSLIAVATALLHGLGPVAMSNESSASVPNLHWRGHEINHQWSKGIEAEGLLRQALDAHAGLPRVYFSLLRGMSELHIAKTFAQFTAYDDVVTSCNVAFKLSGASSRWCATCPKCRFVFLALAPFTGRARLTAIFGTDMLADPGQLPGYRELTGITAHKPFECVGETEESLAAVRLLAEHEDWSDALVVKQLRAEIPDTQWPSAADVAAAFRGDAPTFAPPGYARALAGIG
jgi:hypothetical protein